VGLVVAISVHLRRFALGTTTRTFLCWCRHHHNSLNLVWLAKHDLYCSRKETCIITVHVIDDHRDDLVVGHLFLQLEDLLDGNEAGCKTGEVMILAVWRLNRSIV